MARDELYIIIFSIHEKYFGLFQFLLSNGKKGKKKLFKRKLFPRLFLTLNTCPIITYTSIQLKSISLTTFLLLQGPTIKKALVVYHPTSFFCLIFLQPSTHLPIQNNHKFTIPIKPMKHHLIMPFIQSSCVCIFCLLLTNHIVWIREY